jgi:hypothetical protein
VGLRRPADAAQFVPDMECNGRERREPRHLLGPTRSDVPYSGHLSAGRGLTALAAAASVGAAAEPHSTADARGPASIAYQA